VTLDTHNDIDLANFTAERNYAQDLPTQVILPKMFAGTDRQDLERQSAEGDGGGTEKSGEERV